MMVIFLTGLVSMILMRTLRSDYAKYAREDDDLESLERDVSEESGWKLVHGDVFQPPRSLVVLSAVVGIGAQLAVLILVVILFSIVATLYIGRGAIVTTFVVSYAHVICVWLCEWWHVFSQWRCRKELEWCSKQPLSRRPFLTLFLRRSGILLYLWSR
uniref:transmembrane 9 superfamily member 1-like isoform X1 n=1 Tax=Erigeron canadensis TaxID=72917 RepID=UPI001CB9D3BC|nr:transmembrane 9 superfamily member 1-like isoform X1 [Erigeron canadensis]